MKNIAQRIIKARTQGPWRLAAVPLRAAIHLLAGFLISALIVTRVPQVRAEGVASTAFDFLKFGSGARQMGLGNSGVAISGDVNSAYYNPAALSDLTQQEAGFLHAQWFQNITQQYAAYAYPNSKLGTFGFNWNRVSYGDVQGYNRFNEKTATLNPSASALTFTYANAFQSGLAFGFNTRYIKEDLAVSQASAYGFDVGMLYRANQDKWWTNFDVGVAAKNLGTKVRHIQQAHSQPFQIDAGIATSQLNGASAQTFEVHRPSDRGMYFSFGMEFTARKIFTLRVGYRTQQDLAKGVSVGGGFELWEDKLQLDYTFVPFEEFSNVHRVGIIYRFGGLAESSYRRGLRLMRNGKYAEAILEFNNALDYKPNHKQAIRNMRKCGRLLRTEDRP